MWSSAGEVDFLLHFNFFTKRFLFSIITATNKDEILAFGLGWLSYLSHIYIFVVIKAEWRKKGARRWMSPLSIPISESVLLWSIYLYVLIDLFIIPICLILCFIYQWMITCYNILNFKEHLFSFNILLGFYFH